MSVWCILSQEQRTGDDYVFVTTKCLVSSDVELLTSLRRFLNTRLGDYLTKPGIQVEIDGLYEELKNRVFDQLDEDTLGECVGRRVEEVLYSDCDKRSYDVNCSLREVWRIFEHFRDNYVRYTRTVADDILTCC